MRGKSGISQKLECLYVISHLGLGKYKNKFYNLTFEGFLGKISPSANHSKNNVIIHMHFKNLALRKLGLIRLAVAVVSMVLHQSINEILFLSLLLRCNIYELCLNLKPSKALTYT